MGLGRGKMTGRGPDQRVSLLLQSPWQLRGGGKGLWAVPSLYHQLGVGGEGWEGDCVSSPHPQLRRAEAHLPSIDGHITDHTFQAG